MKTTDLPYPEHTPPTAPEGMKWKYCGKAWCDQSEKRTFYCVNSQGEVGGVVKINPIGVEDFHYFEAAPILKDSGFTIAENPKESEGKKKCPMHLLPPEFLIQTAHVMGFGADRYGAWNFRDTPIKLSTYLGAMMRHLTAVADGEDIDESGFPHIAHIAASAAIVLDAAKHGKLIDDRPSKL